MNTIPIILPSFAAGELSPFLYGRVDLAKFHVGCRTLQNFLVHPHGGASNRPGTRFIGEVDDSTRRHRLIPFQFRSSPSGQNYMLVFGDQTMQVVMQNGATWGFVLLASKAITGATRANPGKITCIGHGFSTNTRVAIAGVGGMTQLNGNTYTITVVDADHFTIGVDTTGFGAYTSGGTAGSNVFTLVTPYAYTDLPKLKFVQSADTMTLVHSGYAPRQLTRTGHANWQIATITFAPATPAPTNVVVTGGTGSTIQVTAINDSNGEESLPSASASNGQSFSWTAVAGCTNYNIYKQSGSVFGFVAQVNTNSWTDNNIAPDIGNTAPGQRNPFSLNTITGVTVQNGGSGYSSPTVKAVDNAGSAVTFTAHVSGGVITSVNVNSPGRNYSPNVTLQITDGGGSGGAIQVDFANDGGGLLGAEVLAGGSGYHSGAYAVIVSPEGGGGATVSLTVSAGAITGVTVVNPGSGYHWNFVAPYAVIYDAAGSGGVLVPVLTADTTTFPQCTTYYQQRQAFAGTMALPQTLWFSVTGAFNNMNISEPTKDDDAITRSLTSREVNEIRHLVPAGSSMLAMTSGAEWRVYPGTNSSGLTPGSCVTLPQTSYGCSHVPPIWNDNSLLFVQERGSRVRELRFDVLQDQYQSSDLSVLAQHLLYDTSASYQIQEWAFAEEPFRVVWCVRSDGTMLGFTWMREHQVYAWHRHVTDGVVESVATIPESDGRGGYIDAVYLIVKRNVGGTIHRYVERMVERFFAVISDAWFVDCGLQYVAANTNGSATVSIRSNSFDNSYEAGASMLAVVFDQAGSFLTAAMVGAIVSARSGSDSVQVQITQVADGNNAFGTLLQACPAALQNVATSNWTMPGVTTVTQLSGLGHLNGKTVTAMGDGSVIPSMIVTNGEVTLDGPYTEIIVGLGYQSVLSSLNLELPSQGGTVQGQPKKISQVTLRCKDTRGAAVGIEQEVLVGGLQGTPITIEIKERSTEALGTAVQPFTGDRQITIPEEWNRGGRLSVVQNYPLPVSVLALVPEVTVGD